MENLKYLVCVMGLVSFFAMDGLEVLGLIIAVSTIVLGTYLKREYGKNIFISIGTVFAWVKIISLVLLMILTVISYNQL